MELTNEESIFYSFSTTTQQQFNYWSIEQTKVATRNNIFSYRFFATDEASTVLPVPMLPRAGGWCCGTTTWHPLLQRKYALLKVHICVGKVYTNAFNMRCLKCRCKDLLQHLFMCWYARIYCNTYLCVGNVY
jgi:hypothetical protein